MNWNQRYWLIELLAYWEGKINSKPIMKCFGLSRQSASSQLKNYLKDHPENLYYDNKLKAYRVSGTFESHYISQSVDEYFDWLSNSNIPTRLANQPSVSLYRIEPLSRYISPVIIRPLIRSVKEQTAVDCEYLSVSSSDPNGRLIYPHTFVHTANRWHIRAYCALRQQYLDFVLSRFQSIEYDGEKATYTVDQDELWNTQVDLVFAPDSRLTNKQKQILENDYGMRNGQLTFQTRAALIKYTLDDLQIKTKMLEANPQAQQLICVNYSDIKQWLYD